MDKEIEVLLMKIKIEALRQISLVQRDGKAIQECELEDKPEFEDFDNVDVNTDEQAVAILSPETTLEEILKDEEKPQTKTEDKQQINIDEAIKEAEAVKSERDEPLQENTSAQDVVNVKPKRFDKVKAFLDARREWHIKRMELDYAYECSKKETYDRIYGFEYMIGYVDSLMRELDKKDKKINASNNNVASTY